MKKIFLVFILVFNVIACSYHSETKDSVEAISYTTEVNREISSIGRLRKLVILPVELFSFKGKHKTSEDLLSAELFYEKQCHDYLMEVKGYEIISIRESDPDWEKNMIKKNGYKNLTGLLNSFPKSVITKDSSKIIQGIGRQFNADGVLVVRLKEEEPWDALDGIMNIALMNLPLVYQMSSPDIGAWIYETASGRLVWKQEEAVFGGDANMKINVQSLFREMENAVPIQIIDEVNN